MAYARAAARLKQLIRITDTMKLQKYLSVLLCIAVASMFLCSCSSEATKSDRLSIVSTIFPPYDFARQITGGNADITMLLRAGQESHTYEPTAQDILTIQSCDLFIYIGGENDVWVDDILSSFDKPVNTLRLIDYCVTADEQPLNGAEKHGGHDHETDEHVWTSLSNAQLMCRAICDELSALDQGNAQVYSDNCDKYCAELGGLDGQFRDTVANGKRQELVFGDRFAFRYFADDYGIDCYAAFSGCSAESEPSAKTLAFLIDKVQSDSIPLVLYIEFSPQTVADSIAEQTGCKTALFHSCHNVTRQELEGGATYLSLMKGNLEVLKEALG